MVDRWVSWSCDTCHKHYSTGEEAERCEFDHILEASAEKMRADIKAIFAGKKPIKVTRQPSAPTPATVEEGKV